MSDDAEERVLPSLEELWATAWRRRWWFLSPLFLCWLAVWGVSWLLPTKYESEATILVEQQKVPEHFVTPNVTVNLQDRLQSMTQQILSRTRLQKTIDDFHLYSPAGGLGRLLQSGDSVEQLRKDIKIELVQAGPSPGRPSDLTAFKIHYSGSSPIRAQQVNSELTTLFIDENVRSVQQSSEDTTTFLASQLGDARVKLEEQEAKVKAFKVSHLGELPSQLESNVGILSGLQVQLESVLRALDNARQQKLYLESQLQQFQSAKAALVGSGDATSPETVERELFVLRQRLADERSRHTDEYPEIIAIKQKIAEAEKLKKEMDVEIAANEKASAAENSGLTDGLSSSYSSPLMQLRSQLKANALEIQNYQQRGRSIESEMAAYKARLNITPETEQELADISRGYEESKANYASLLQKQNQSQLATSLSQRQQGEQFRVLDPPSLPEKPATPNHLLWSLGGLAFGGIVGVGLILFQELTNVRVRQEKDLSELVPARVLVCIPHLGTPEEAQFAVASRRRQVAAAVAMVLLMVAGNFYAFYKG
jgi:succinoglycan biosynthesis transport protein ExoP